MSRTEKATAQDDTRTQAGTQAGTQAVTPGRGRRRAWGRELSPALNDRLSDCRCGQQLDMCARAHCPRCGRSINQT